MRKTLLAIMLMFATLPGWSETFGVDTTIEQLETKLSESGPNASLLFNLGNRYFDEGQFGRAILAYEQARVIDPRSRDIRTNLELARKEVAAFDEAFQLPPFFWLSLNEWAVACLIGLLGMGLYLVGRVCLNWTRGSLIAGWFLALSSLFLFLGVTALALRYPEVNRAIVIVPDVVVRLSPFATADSRGTLKEGESVQIERMHEGWVHVGNGWVSGDEVKRVMQ